MTSRSILIVEDESIVALDLKIRLQQLGYAVPGIAASGEQAIRLAAELRPSLILMDVRLQGALDGIEAAEAIRRDQRIPIIFLTSHSDDETVQRAARTAPYGYLTKPYQIKELRAGVEVALAKAGMEQQLREADQWFAHTLRCVTDGVVLTDTQSRVRFLNPAAEKLTGWTIDEAVGRPVGDVVRLHAPVAPAISPSSHHSPRATHDAAAVVQRVLGEGRPSPVAHALRIVARDGVASSIDEAAGPVDDDSGARLGAVLVLRDATDRVAQEALLRASEERFRGAFDHAPLGMALVSLAGEIIQVNAAFCLLLDGCAESIKRRPYASLALASDGDHETDRLHELMSRPTGVVQFERRYCRLGDGAPVSSLVSVSLMHEAGQPTCYLYQVHDLTEQKKAAEQLAELANERMKREASELASKAKSDFISRASHEMHTPLNAMIGFAQLLEHQQGSDPARTLSYAQHIRKAGEHMLRLVTDLLDLNRASQGQLSMTLEPVGLHGVADDVLHLLEGFAQSHGIALDNAVPADLVAVADPVRLRQVLLNLGTNAIKYNRDGGRACIGAQRSMHGRLHLTVTDTGIGMTREQLERLYQPFDRLGQERSKIPGVGLGLVIAKGLVMEMGGEMEVSSQPRVGTAIRIELGSSAP